MAATSFSSRSLRRAPMATFAPRSASSLAAASAGGRTGAPFPAVVVLLDQAVLLLFRETEVVAVDGVLVDRVAADNRLSCLADVVGHHHLHFCLDLDTVDRHASVGT